MQLTDFEKARVLVIGDLMLDRYWHGATSRISPEAPVPVVHVNQIEERAGGAGNVALNIAALQAQAHVIGYSGLDEAGDKLISLLENAGVVCDLERTASSPTITKLRVLSRHQQLIRLDFEESFYQQQPQALLKRIENAIPSYQAIVLSDYGKGTLAEVQAVIQMAQNANVPVLVDPKGNDFSIYRGATVITPNFSEFVGVVGPCDSVDAIIEKGRILIQQLDLQALLVTRGEQGMMLLQADGDVLELPASAREVYDVTGAGDTVISTLAVALAAGIDLPDATHLANTAAAIVVGKLGTATLTTDELLDALSDQTPIERGVLALDELKKAMETARRSGERIVATNGCFDILHSGHLRYLQEAKSLGDRLLVLVNSDASVQQLKGNSRPINPLAVRMEMLAGLECVDWVIDFNEETPRDLYCELLPDVLVKGGDYPRIEDIAGHDCVIANGGEVKVLSFVDGYSTTKVIEKIRQTEKA